MPPMDGFMKQPVSNENKCIYIDFMGLYVKKPPQNGWYHETDCDEHFETFRVHFVTQLTGTGLPLYK